jgi:hypothetical protein
MPVIIEQKDNGLGLIINLSGYITCSDIISATKQIYENDVKNTHVWELWNLIDVNDIEASSGEIKQLSDLDKNKAKSRNSKLIIAAALPTDVSFGLGRMYEALVNHPQIITHMFHNLNEAKNWIDKVKEAIRVQICDVENHSSGAFYE